MRWVTSRLAARRAAGGSGEEGFAMVFIAVILVMLVGMVAFAIDVSALYEERRELQSGADASVLAIAEACVREEPCNAAVASATAHDYADFNTKDGSAGVAEVDLDTSAGKVAVTTETEQPDGTTVFAPFFARVIGFDGTTVRARAEAIYGYAGKAEVLPLIISECEWDREKDKKHDPPYDPLKEVTFYFHDGQAAEECNAQPGHDQDANSILAGGFGWLDSNGDCVATVENGNIVIEDPGASPSTGCSPSVLYDTIFDNNPILLPWFLDAWGLGANGQYEVKDFMAFYVTGYNFGGQYKVKSSATGDYPCKGDDRCISGYITTKLDPDADIGGGNRGVLVVRLTK